ncbi:MAG: alpha/beta hydrolase [Pseudomonadota bacterium]
MSAARVKSGFEPGWGERGFFNANGLRTAFQRAGPRGAPVVILLHGSPESADALSPIAERLIAHFDVIGLDTPGNGLSEGLPLNEPSSEDYADQLGHVLDGFGVTRAGLYGFHTGAGTAMSFALSRPERVSALALDGYAVWTAAERADLLANYLLTYPPVWDGSHLIQTWARLDEQLIFFPWYDTRLAARMPAGAVALEVRLRRLRDWLLAWQSYVKPYRAAFKRRGEIGPDQVSAPTLIGAMDRDPLSVHLDRLQDCAASVEIRGWGDDREAALSTMQAHLKACPGAPANGEPAPASPPVFAEPPPGLSWKPDEHGGFLVALWAAIRRHALEAARSEAELAAALDPEVLQAQLLAHIAQHTGLAPRR